jgi:hypothetical protein
MMKSFEAFLRAGSGWSVAQIASSKRNAGTCLYVDFCSYILERLQIAMNCPPCMLEVVEMYLCPLFCVLIDFRRALG